MRSVSSRFLAAVRMAHTVVVRCELYFPGSSTPIEVPVTAGAVSFDRSAMVRRTGHVEIPWSLGAASDLDVDIRTLPLGGYCELSRGILYPDGVSELVSLGYYRVESVTWRTTEDRAGLELADRMAQVRDEEFVAPFSAVGMRTAEAAEEIARQVFGDSIAYRILHDPLITLADVVYSGNRADAIMALATSIGGDVYFDGDGDFVFDGAPGAVQITRNGMLTDDSPVVTGLGLTSDLAVGMSVNGTGLPPGLRIQSIDSSDQITLTGRVNTWGMKNARSEPGSPVLTKISDTSDLTAGMVITEAHLPPGPITVRAVNGPDRVTMSANATAAPVEYEWFFVFTVPNPVQLLFSGSGGAVGYPVWLVDTGERGVMVEAEETLDRTSVFNGVLVTGQDDATQAPVSALVYDDDPGSPTLWGGPFGKVPHVEQSSAVQTASQAMDAAKALLDRKLGLTRSVVLGVAPNPALEAGDIIDVAFVDGRRERHVIESLALDLGPSGSQSLVVRSVFGPSAGRRHADLPRRRYGALYGRAAWREAQNGLRRSHGDATRAGRQGSRTSGKLATAGTK